MNNIEDELRTNQYNNITRLIKTNIMFMVLFIILSLVIIFMLFTTNITSNWFIDFALLIVCFVNIAHNADNIKQYKSKQLQIIIEAI